MKTISQFFRLLRIQWLLLRYHLDDFLFALPWLAPFAYLKFLNPWRWRANNDLTRGERIRIALESLGPIFIKAGQVVSTRRDIFPEDIVDELVKLQDRVPPCSPEVSEKMIIQALGRTPVEAVFTSINYTALASASIAQVHEATLLDGRQVVVKILRPNVRQMIQRDLDLLMTFAKFVQRYVKESRRFKPIGMVEEISHTLYDELDLLREGANASQLRRNFLNSDQLTIPEIVWTHSNHQMLVMERVEGIPVHDVKALRQAGINMKRLAERGIEIFLTQVFRDRFFHADMHPGNIFVSEQHKEFPRFIAVDFGIVGSLNANDQRYLAENLYAFFKRDYRRVAELHLHSGWLDPDARLDQFESDIRAVCEPIFERPLKDISFGQLLLRLFQAARRFNINIQPQLILLQKTLLNVEGLGRQLYPDLDLWATAAPFLEKWLKQQVGLKAFVKGMRQNLPYWAERLPGLPMALEETLRTIQKTSLPQKPKPTYPWKERALGVGLGFFLSSLILLIKPAFSDLSLCLLALAILFFVLLIP